jgi:hypothetical protein
MSQDQSKKPRVKVLYQRLGDTWYAFATVGEELFIGKVPVSATATEAEAAATFEKSQAEPKAEKLVAAA